VGDWQPGVVVWIVIFAAGIGGTVFCALRVRDALADESVRNVVEEVVIEEIPSVEECPCPTECPEKARWDVDSGPDHKFPPQLR